MMTLRGNRGFIIAFWLGTLSFVLAWVLEDATPFTVVGGAAVAGKWLENVVEKKNLQPEDRK